MKKPVKLTLLACWFLASFADGSASGPTLIIGDQYDVTGSGSGFALGSGVNSRIKPTDPHLTGIAAPNLRYIKIAGTKDESAHIIADNKLAVARITSNCSTPALSTGIGAYDFSAALGTLAATPAVSAVYEITLSIDNSAAGNQCCSFGLGASAGGAGF